MQENIKAQRQGIDSALKAIFDSSIMDLMDYNGYEIGILQLYCSKHGNFPLVTFWHQAYSSRLPLFHCPTTNKIDQWSFGRTECAVIESFRIPEDLKEKISIDTLKCLISFVK